MIPNAKKPPALGGADCLQNNVEQSHFTAPAVESQDAQLTKLCSAGLHLVAIAPINGKPTKAPTTKGWNLPRSAENPHGYSSDATDFASCGADYNFGVHHGASNTLALDLDDLELAQRLFEELTDLQLLDWLESEQRIQIKSPKANRGKLLFKLPEGFEGAGVKCKKPNPDKPKHHDIIFELRSGNGAQDVIIGEHPEGGDYQFIGDPAAIPDAPTVLLDMLQHWDAWKLCFDSALGIEPGPPENAPRRPQQGENLPDWRSPIDAFNQSHSLAEVLTRNGYKPKGRNRFLRPGSSSKAPGAVILRNCTDGIERIYSHGGDELNDGYAHDAFDCMRLLEHCGKWEAALNWSPEITKHNQQLYKQQRQQADMGESGFNWGSDNKKEQKKRSERPPFPFIRADELTAKLPTIDWLLENIIERRSLNLLFGEPGAGKSLLALDWAFCTAAGIDWHGFRTQPVDVVVIAGEGHAGMGRRLIALEVKYQRKAPSRLIISKRPANLSDEKNAQWVAETVNALCQNPGLVIVDTLHRNMTGDENSSQNIGRFISNLDNYFKPLGAAVLVVHHSGHGQKDRSRGSSSIRAAMDGEFSVTKDGGAIVLNCYKSKDFEAFKPLQFSLKPVDLEWCDDGEPLTSVYLEHDGEAKSTTKKRRLSARDDAILTSLSEAIASHGVSPTAEIRAKFGGFDSLTGKYRKIVNIEHWRELAYKAIVVDANTEDARRMAFKRCRDKLLNQGVTVEYDNYAWRIFE